jgi:hypothetical protein
MFRVVSRILLVILGLAGIGAGICIIRRKRRDRWVDELDMDCDCGSGYGW